MGGYFLGVEEGHMLNNITYTHMKIYVKSKKNWHHRSSEKNVSYQETEKHHAVAKKKKHHYVLSHMEIHKGSSVVVIGTGMDIGNNMHWVIKNMY